jgi:hypothetical protein
MSDDYVDYVLLISKYRGTTHGSTNQQEMPADPLIALDQRSDVAGNKSCFKEQAAGSSQHCSIALDSCTCISSPVCGWYAGP